MEIYLVGGAVRDELLGLPVRDRDWVVVGVTPAQMSAQGFLSVGRDFPVFLHPDTHEEYALARTERKTAAGYHGFAFHAAPEVTLEQDLARRDLTINAIAKKEGSTGACGLIDPYFGQKDLAARVLRHVTDAFREDPVRILRAARFAARFDDFTVAPETLQLMREMVAAGEVDALVPERVWQELSRGLMERTPSRMFALLRDCGALQKLLPEVDCLWSVPQPAMHHRQLDTGAHRMRVLDLSARLDAPLAVRFACLTLDLGSGATRADLLPRPIDHEQHNARLLQGLCDRWRVPNEVRQLAELVAREHRNIQRSGALDAAALLRLLERCDAIRKPARFADALLACECEARGGLGRNDAPYPQRARLLAALAAAQALATAPIAAAAIAAGLQGDAVGARIQAARGQAIAAALSA